MRKLLQYGGIVILIAIGIGAIYSGFDGRSFALLLSGIGFTVLTLGALVPADRRRPGRAPIAPAVPVA